jgi:methyl-accepting chemotaxis protein
MLNNIKIGTKLIGGFIVVALIAAVIGVTGILCQHSLAGANVDLYAKATVPEGELIDMTASLQGLRIGLRDIILNSDKQKYAAKINGYREDLAKRSESFEKTIDSPQTRKDFEDFNESRKRFDGFIDRIIALASTGKEKEAEDVIFHGDALAVVTAEQEAFNRMHDEVLASAEGRMKDSSALASRASMLMIAATLIGLAVALGLGVWLTGSITKPIRKVVEVLEALAAGDLSQHLETQAKDEIGQMERCLGTVTSSLTRTIAEIRSRSRRPRSRSPRAPPHRRRLPRRPRHRWSRWPRTSSRTPTTRSRPTRSPTRALGTRRRAARACWRRSRR